MAIGQQFAGDLGVAFGAGELIDDLAIPIEIEPGQAIEDGGDRGLGGAGAVGILDAQAELAAVVAGVEIVEQRGAGAADVQEAGGRRRETGDDLCGCAVVEGRVLGCHHGRSVQC